MNFLNILVITHLCYLKWFNQYGVSSGFGAAKRVEICHFPLTWTLAYTTACTTVQAVINLWMFQVV